MIHFTYFFKKAYNSVLCFPLQYVFAMKVIPKDAEKVIKIDDADMDPKTKIGNGGISNQAFTAPTDDTKEAENSKL